MKLKKLFAAALASILTAPLFCEGSPLNKYFNQSFHGSMLGKIVTADIKILDEQTIDFTANLPAGKKNHTYTYKILQQSEKEIVTQWFENGKTDKTVTFTDFEENSFLMKVKGKGKVQMKKQ